MTVRPKPRAPVEGTGVGEGQETSSAILRATEPFDRFYEREFKPVVGLAYALSGSRAASEDLAQEAFIAAHRNWEKVGTYDNPGAWVRRVVSNLAVSRFRKLSSEIKAVARLTGFGRSHAEIEELPSEADGFWANVRKLPKRQAQTLALHYLEDRPVNEIAAILECSPSTVKVHLHKGRKRLAATLGIDMGDQA